MRERRLTVLLNDTLQFTCKCSVLYNSYKCGTEVQTSSMVLHRAILRSMHTRARKYAVCRGGGYVMSNGSGPIIHPLIRQGRPYMSAVKLVREPSSTANSVSNPAAASNAAANSAGPAG